MCKWDWELGAQHSRLEPHLRAHPRLLEDCTPHHDNDQPNASVITPYAKSERVRRKTWSVSVRFNIAVLTPTRYERMERLLTQLKLGRHLTELCAKRGEIEAVVSKCNSKPEYYSHRANSRYPPPAR